MAEKTQKKLRNSDLSGLVGYQIKRAYVRIHSDFRQTIAPFDLTQRTFSVLSLVSENPNVSQSAVSRELGIERSGTVVIIDHLETRGLVTRNAVITDKRAYALRVTPAGSALYAQALAAIRDHEARVLDDLSGDEIAQLQSLLGRVAR